MFRSFSALSERHAVNARVGKHGLGGPAKQGCVAGEVAQPPRSLSYTSRSTLGLSFGPISNGSGKYIDVYIFQCFEFNAISAHACLADLFCIRPG